MVCCQSTTLLSFGVTTFLTILFSKTIRFGIMRNVYYNQYLHPPKKNREKLHVGLLN